MGKMINERLRDLRKSKNLTIAQLAEKLGISSTTISIIESGRKVPTIGSIIKFAEGCGYAMEVNFVPIGEECSDLTIDVELDNRSKKTAN